MGIDDRAAEAIYDTIHARAEQAAIREEARLERLIQGARGVIHHSLTEGRRVELASVLSAALREIEGDWCTRRILAEDVAELVLAAVRGDAQGARDAAEAVIETVTERGWRAIEADARRWTEEDGC